MGGRVISDVELLHLWAGYDTVTAQYVTTANVKFITIGSTVYKPVRSLSFVMRWKFCSILESLPIVVEDNILLQSTFDAL